MAGYRSGNGSVLLTSRGLWSLIVLSISACCAAWGTSNGYRRREEERESGIGLRPGLREMKGFQNRWRVPAWSAEATSSARPNGRRLL